MLGKYLVGKVQRVVAQKKSYSRAFALPTVLITSVVMLLVLLAAIQSVVSVSESIRGQYTDKIGKEAVQSGVALAKACMAKNSGSITWTNAKPLKPNTDCTGTETLSCPANSTDTRCYVMIQGLYRTSYSVGVTTDSGGTAIGIDAKGITREVRKTSGDVIGQSTSSLKVATTALGLLQSVGATNSLVSLTTGGYGYGYASSGAGGSQTLLTGTKLCGLTSAGEVWCAGSKDITTSNGGTPAYYFGFGYGSTSADLGYLGGPTTCYNGNATSTSACTGSSSSYADDVYLTNLSDSSTGIFRGKTFRPQSSPTGTSQAYLTY